MLKRTLLSLGLLLALMPAAMFESMSTLRSHAQATDGSNVLYFPEIKLGQGWETTISLTNLADRKISVRVEGYRKDGSPLDLTPAIFSLDIGETRTIEAETLPEEIGFLKVQSDGDVTGNALFRSLDGKKQEAIPTIRCSDKV